MKDNMQAKLTKKLTLHKETIRALTDQELHRVAGGVAQEADLDWRPTKRESCGSCYIFCRPEQ